MSPQEILRRSRSLAQAVLRESIVELRHEAKSGCDKERIIRFCDLAIEADALLSAEVTERAGIYVVHAKPKRRRSSSAEAKRAKETSAVDKTARAMREAERAANRIAFMTTGKPETKKARVLRLLEPGSAVKHEEFGFKGKWGNNALSKAVLKLRAEGHEIECSDGTYRLVKP